MSQVTWRRHDDIHPLTIGLFTFVGDPRIGVDYSQRTSEWSLIIEDVRPTDDGLYQCQISTKSDDHDSSYDVQLNVKGTVYSYSYPKVRRYVGLSYCFWATVCKTVCPVLRERCAIPACPSVCNVGVLSPNGWMDQDATWYGGRPRPRRHCVRRGPSSPSPRERAHVYCGQTVADLSNC